MPFIKSNQAGVSLIEVTVALGLFAIMSLAVANSYLLASSTTNHSMTRSIAEQLARDTIEDFAATNPLSLDDSSGFTDTVVFERRQFNRSVTVSIDTNDRSRRVIVAITPTVTKEFTITVENSYALWGTR